MKKITFITMGALLISSFVLSGTTYSGIIKSNDNSPNSTEITLHSDTDVYGVQFDFGYDSSALTLNEDGIVSKIDNVSVYSKVIEPGHARVIMFSLSGDPVLLSGSNLSSIIDISFDSVLGSDVSTTLKITNLILAGINGVGIECETTATFDFESGIPEETSLGINYPNPFNPTTTIPFEISNSGYVELKVYNMNGSFVKSLVSDYKDAGSYEVVWKGSNNDNQKVASGQYILKMTAPGFSKTQQMTFLK